MNSILRIYFCAQNSKMKKILLFTFKMLYFSVLYGQNSPLTVFTKREKGIEIIQKDSLFSLQFQFRMQNRAAYMSTTESDLTPESFEFRVRRLRLRMKGFVINPKIGYYIQLSFSRGDMDWEAPQGSINNSSPNIVRDAVIYYQPLKSLKFAFGQTKLPGNRQRVISSGNQQFADRSIVNATYTIDRDFGFFANYERNYFMIKGAITSGEGRNSTKSSKGLNYTGRIEIFPFGRFTGDNDDCEGDLAREKKPKFVLSGTYNYNHDAIRQGGTLGNDLFENVNLTNIHIDALFKYKGFAFYNEFCQRNASNPITFSPLGTSRIVYTGFGMLSQASYIFKNNYEIAARLAVINPNKEIYDNILYNSLNEKRLEQWQLGVTKYIYGHRLKVQGNLVYHIAKDLKNQTQKGQLGAIFQVELGI